MKVHSHYQICLKLHDFTPFKQKLSGEDPKTPVSTTHFALLNKVVSKLVLFVEKTQICLKDCLKFKKISHPVFYGDLVGQRRSEFSLVRRDTCHMPLTSKFDNKLLLRCIQHFYSDLINII